MIVTRSTDLDPLPQLFVVVQISDLHCSLFGNSAMKPWLSYFSIQISSEADVSSSIDLRGQLARDWFTVPRTSELHLRLKSG